MTTPKRVLMLFENPILSESKDVIIKVVPEANNKQKAHFIFQPTPNNYFYQS